MRIINWKKIWKDPVWSKVISAGLVFIIAQFAIFIWSLIININFYQVYQQIFRLLSRKYQINGWIIITTLIFLVYGLYFLFRDIFLNQEKLGKPDSNSQDEIKEEDLTITEEPTIFFHQRFCDAFPGYRYGVQWFNSKSMINYRLSLLLSHPTKFNKAGHDSTIDPIWWYRGSSAMFIEHFEILKGRKVLINIDELIIEKIAAFRGRHYYQDFIYVQCLPDKPTGLYKIDLSRINQYEEYREDFGIYKGKLISRLEYDDGSAIVKGKPKRVEEADLRTRTLSKYNFIITAKSSPYNCDKFDINSEVYFDRLLKGEITFDDFIAWMETFPKNRFDY